MDFFSPISTAQNAFSEHLPFAPNFETAARAATFSGLILEAKKQFFPLAERWENTKNKHQKNTAAEFLFVVTTDGLRWQEVFEGADSSILSEIENRREQYLPKKPTCPTSKLHSKNDRAMKMNLQKFLSEITEVMFWLAGVGVAMFFLGKILCGICSPPFF